MVKTGLSFSPCQITGFFRIHDTPGDPLKIGSTGAGVNLQQGVTTAVRVSRASRTKLVISFNGKPLAHPVVSRTAAQEPLDRSWAPLGVPIDHRRMFP